VEIHDKLDELGEVIESARAVPMSASCMVNRADVLALLDQVRRQLPSDLTRADALLADAEGVRAQARRQGEEIIASAHEEKMRLVSETEVQAQAEREAGRIIAGAEAEAERMQREIDDYIDAKLANFELVLTKTLEAVARGRDKIAGRRAVEELSGIDLPDFDEEPGADGQGADGQGADGQGADGHTGTDPERPAER
jgi:cell division septum initiation protein DivIVA